MNRSVSRQEVVVMNRIKLWPQGILIVLAFAGFAAIAVALWTKYERTADAKALPNAARIERVEGQVGMSQNLDNSNSQWIDQGRITPSPWGIGFTRERTRAVRSHLQDVILRRSKPIPRWTFWISRANGRRWRCAMARRSLT